MLCKIVALLFSLKAISALGRFCKADVWREFHRPDTCLLSRLPCICLQTLHIVRHGESEYNAATMSKEDFADPLVFDPKLTAKGRRQVCLMYPMQLTLLHLSTEI